MNFALILVVVTAVTGVIWALDRWLLAPRRAPGEGPNGVIDFARGLFPVVLVVLLVRSFVAEPFRIPSGSMMPTLLTGDFILVNKFAYGLRLPVSNLQIVPIGEPARGDVVVFRFPEDPSKDFIKRVIGLPGDEIVYFQKQLFINGEPVPTEYLDRYTGPGARASDNLRELLEDLPGARHHILEQAGRRSLNIRYRVPADAYFVMGDNRDNSDDSRRWGPVPSSHLVGRAFLIWMNWDSERLHPIFARIGQRIE
ncbi:MAG TPA: signal peptidase I [Gammaproteobacteria bacterium]|nr:signal peptidase I [Gammaproteobacteria bacterium]